jgi:hypothetical protein
MTSASPVFNGSAHDVHHHRVNVSVVPSLHDRNRLTTLFRPVLAIPHLLLVGAPAGIALSIGWRTGDGPRLEWGATTGVLGAVAGVCALIAWFAIIFGAQYPNGLRALALFYLRWRVRAAAYFTLLTDEYPPFGDADYPAAFAIELPGDSRRYRWSVAFRLVLIIPQALAVWALGIVWMLTTLAAWCAILFTGRFPAVLYEFGVGMLRWSARVEAYLLLLHDDYPPFSLD